MIVTYNGHDLTAIPFVEIDRREIHAVPKRNIKTEYLARNDGEKIMRAFYGSRTIEILGHIYAPDRATLETARDALMAYLIIPNSALVVDYGVSSRLFNCTVDNTIFTEVTAGFTQFTISFVCSDPFGYDTATSSISFTSPITTASSDQNITLGGSWLAEPIITLTLSSGTGLTNKTINVTNTATGEFIGVQRTWVAGDILQINSSTKVVTVNSVSVDYNGVFPKWQPIVPGVLRYTDDLTTRSVVIAGTYVKRYI